MAGYGDDAALTAWLGATGHTLPVGAPTLAVLRERGSGFVDGSYEARFVGIRAGGFAQERSWPRSSAVLVSGETVPDDVIPFAVINASFDAAYAEASTPGSLSAAGSASSRVKREKVEGAVEVEYQASSANSNIVADLTPVLTTVEGLLKPFLKPDDIGAGVGIWSVGC